MEGVEAEVTRPTWCTRKSAAKGLVEDMSWIIRGSKTGSVKRIAKRAEKGENRRFLTSLQSSQDLAVSVGSLVALSER